MTNTYVKGCWRGRAEVRNATGMERVRGGTRANRGTRGSVGIRKHGKPE
jgi:hypothetical protein